MFSVILKVNQSVLSPRSLIRAHLAQIFSSKCLIPPKTHTYSPHCSGRASDQFYVFTAMPRYFCCAWPMSQTGGQSCTTGLPAASSWDLKVKRIFVLSLLVLCIGIFGYSRFYFPMKKFSFPFFSFVLQVVPSVPHLWCPAVQCPECSLYPNDHVFSFCQRCGYRRI